jgi:hypothetical protein
MRCDLHVDSWRSLGFRCANGETGNIWKLTRYVLAVGRSIVRTDPRTLPAACLALAVAALALGDYTVEQNFARWWISRYRRLRATGGNYAATPIAEVPA